MTWKELFNCISCEIENNPQIANEQALVWLHDEDLTTGEHEVFDLAAFDFTEEITQSNRLSMNLKSMVQ